MDRHRRPKPRVRPRYIAAFWALLIGLFVLQAFQFLMGATELPLMRSPLPQAPGAGTIIEVVETRHFAAAEVTQAARQNYGTAFRASNHGVTRVLVRYRSTGQNNALVPIYGRAYIPDKATNAPVLAMAPGTTGIGDGCAASLEQPKVRNWANYESHMMAYASRGYGGIITDYEGMRDPARIHHYMVGVLEGRAVLDGVRALKNLPQAHQLNTKQVFAGGYSQGGHSVYWADSVAVDYAPDVELAGIIGWSPVMDVAETWRGVTAGSTLSWYGPYVLTSYSDFYGRNYNLPNILLPQWLPNLPTDVNNHCIDTNLGFWGIDPVKVFTPQFLADLRTGNLPVERYGMLQTDLEANQVKGDRSTTPKLINQGMRDNVVLPSQQPPALARLCAESRAPASLKQYANSNHYTVMRDSFNDTLAWMEQIRNRQRTASTCPAN
ncbi:MAG TPA: lipase family protein [Candidatus Saccharimonadia bacterium]